MHGEEHRNFIIGQPLRGITPACAGKRPSRRTPCWCGRNHPRMRGEESSRRAALTFLGESPPHARGRAFGQRGQLLDGQESPPHARGRAIDSFADVVQAGITPACAGKSGGIQRAVRLHGNHPRMRGEEVSVTFSMTASVGITPACAGKRVMKMRPPRIWSYPLSANFSLFSKSHLQAPRDPRRRAEGFSVIKHHAALYAMRRGPDQTRLGQTIPRP